MKPIKLNVKTKLQNYPILIGSNLIKNLNLYFNINSIIFNQCLLVIDKKVPEKCGKNIKNQLKKDKMYVCKYT